MNQPPYAARLDRVRAAADEHGLGALAVVPGPNLYYLTGLQLHLSERISLLLIPVFGEPVLVVPALESGKAERAAIAVQIFPWTDADGPAEAIQRAMAEIHMENEQYGVEDRRFRWLEASAMARSERGLNIEGADEVFAAVRSRKDPNELASMERAVRIAEDAWRETLETLRAGVSEREVAAELTVRLLRGGSGPLPFEPIVAAGPNGADPHAVPGDRPLAPGDLVTVDWGATAGGYASDITRCVVVAGAEPRAGLREAYDAVRRANEAGREAARPGATGHDIDRATRAVIEDAGLGEHFIHRTGHGLGLEAHEEPNINRGETEPLVPGMTFTVEPGVYIPALGGCRVEDDVVIEESGARTLTTLPRDLTTVG